MKPVEPKWRDRKDKLNQLKTKVNFICESSVIIAVLKCIWESMKVVYQPIFFFTLVTLHMSIVGLGLFKDYQSPDTCSVNSIVDNQTEITKECVEFLRTNESRQNQTFRLDNYHNILASYISVSVVALDDLWEEDAQKVATILQWKGYQYIIFYIVVIFKTYAIYYTILGAIFVACDKILGTKVRTKELKVIDDQEESNLHPGINHITVESEWVEEEQVNNSTNQGEGENKSKKMKKIRQCMSKMSKFFYAIIFDPFVQQFIVIVILFDLSNIACYGVMLEVNFIKGLLTYRALATLVYLTELFVKLLALNIFGYFKDVWNVLEFAIVFDSVLMYTFGTSIYLYPMIVFRIARFWPTFNIAIRMMARVFRVQVVFLSIFVTLALIMGAIGQASFGRDYYDKQDTLKDRPYPTWHMMDVGHAFLTILRCFCGEWVETLRETIRVSGCLSLPFFLFLIIFVKIIMVHLFTAFQTIYVAIPLTCHPPADDLIEIMAGSVSWYEQLYHFVGSKLCSRRIYVKNMTRESDIVTIPLTRTTASTDSTPEVLNRKESSDCTLWNSIRRKSMWLVTRTAFELFTIGSVIITCVLWIFEYEGTPNSALAREIIAATSLITLPLIFILESVVRILGHGLKGYFSSGFRVLDFLLVAMYLVNAVVRLARFRGSGVSFKVVFVCRVFRLVGLTVKYEAPRTAMNTLYEAFPGVINVTIQGIFIWYTYAIIGVNLFAGKFEECIDFEGNNAPRIDNFTSCVVNNYTWHRHGQSFDDILNTYYSLAHVAIFKGWNGILRLAMDSPMNDQPLPETYFYHFIYFMIFVVFASYFTYILWFGVMIDAYNRQRTKTNEERGIKSAEEELYYKAVILMANRKPNHGVKPRKGCLGVLRQLVESLAFETMILFIIILNLILLAAQHSNESMHFIQSMKYAQMVLVTLFSFGVILLMINRGISSFIQWSYLLDIIAISLIIFNLTRKESISSTSFPPAALLYFKAYNIMRQRGWFKSNRLWSTTMKICPYVAFTFLLEFLVVSCYAVWGNLQWKAVRHQRGEIIYFDTFRDSLVVMYQMTLSAAADVYSAFMTNEENCMTSGDSDMCGKKPVGVLFIVSFVTISYLIVMTLLTVLVLEMYSDAGVRVLERFENVQMNQFYSTWSEYDEDGHGYIYLNQLQKLLDSQYDTFGYDKIGETLDIPIVEGDKVHHRDVLDALFRYSLRQQGLEVKNFEDFELNHSEGDYKPISSTLWRRRGELIE